MKENGQNIDDLFRDNLEDYSEVPSAGVWPDVERKLDEQDRGTGGATGFGPGSKILLLLVAAVALFFTAKWAIGNWNKHHNSDKPAITITNEPNTSNTQSVITPSEPVAPNKTAALINADKQTQLPAPEEDASATGNTSVSALTAHSINPATHSKHSSLIHNTGKHTATVEPVNPPILPPTVFSRDNTNTVKPVVTDGLDQKTQLEKSDIANIDPNTAFVMLGSGADALDMPSYNPNLHDLIKRIRHNLLNNGIEGGLKLGFEQGFKSISASKLTIAPYLQYDISPNLSILLQPTIKYVHLNNTAIEAGQPYYNTTNSTVTTGHTISKGDSLTGAVDTITRRYFYKQTHDSIVIGFQTARKSYFDFDLPILLQAWLTKKLHVYGGIAFNFSKVVQVAEERTTYSNITRTDTVTYAPAPVTNTAPVPPEIDSIFNHTAKPYSSYGSGPIQNPTSDPMKISYMIGFSYKLKDRWMVDLMMQQMLSDASYIPNDKLRNLYKQPYFRISVGYRLFKNKAKKDN